MIGRRWRRLALLMTFGCLASVLLPGSAHAESLDEIAEDYRPVDPANPGGFELSAVNVLLATMAAPPPWLTVITIKSPPPTPTLVTAQAPTPDPITVNGPGIQQTPDPWNPNIPDPIITNINRVPEPATLLSGALGMGVLWLVRRRSRPSEAEEASEA